MRSGADRPLDLEKWLGDPEAIAVQPGFARPATFQVLAGSVIRTLRPAFVFKPDDVSREGDPRLAAMDIGWAQELFGSAGRVSSIQILLKDPAQSETVAEAVRRIVPADARVAPPAARSQEMESMLGAFQLNITAMSLVSVIVGMFLICNSVGAAVIRRRVEIAILRANGVTRGEIRRLFLGEAALEAIAGVALASGWLRHLPAGSPSRCRKAFLRFMSSFESKIRHSRIGKCWKRWHRNRGGARRGMASLFGGSADCDPARILHPGSGIEVFSPLRKRGLAWAILLLGAAAGLCLYSLKGGSKYSGFAAAGAIIAGFSLLVPWLAVAVAFCFRKIRRSFPSRDQPFRSLASPQCAHDRRAGRSHRHDDQRDGHDSFVSLQRSTMDRSIR